MTTSYPAEFREKLRSVLGGVGPTAEVEDELTRLHAEAVEQFLGQHKGLGVDESVAWGDHFFVEALVKAVAGRSEAAW